METSEIMSTLLYKAEVILQSLSQLDTDKQQYGQYICVNIPVLKTHWRAMRRADINMCTHPHRKHFEPLNMGSTSNSSL